MTATVPYTTTARRLLHTLVYRKLGETLLGGSRRRESRVICQELIGLMQGLQLHRGLSGSVLDGETGFSDELDAVEQKLSRSLHALAEHHGENHPILEHAQWQAVIDNWMSLRANWHELDFYTNLFVHSEIINGLVGVLQIMSASFGSHLCGQQGDLIRRWPVLIEQLGVLRALGMHHLACGDVADRRVRTAMEDYLGYCKDGLQRIDAVGMNPATLDRTRRVLRCVDALLEGQRPSLTAQEYYEGLTGVIDAWYHDLQQQVAEAP